MYNSHCFSAIYYICIYMYNSWYAMQGYVKHILYFTLALSKYRQFTNSQVTAFYSIDFVPKAGFTVH